MILDLLRDTCLARIGHDHSVFTREANGPAAVCGVRMVFARGTAGLPRAYASYEAWVAAGRPLPEPVEDEWLDVETSIGIIVSMKPERARQARCRLQVLESRERAAREARLDAQLDNQWFADHWEPLPVLETSERERAAVRRKLDIWLEVKRGERELRELLGD